MTLKTVLFAALFAASAMAAPHADADSVAPATPGNIKRQEEEDKTWCTFHINEDRAAQPKADFGNDDRKLEAWFYDPDGVEIKHVPQTHDLYKKDMLHVDLGLDHEFLIDDGPKNPWRWYFYYGDLKFHTDQAEHCKSGHPDPEQGPQRRTRKYDCGFTCK